MDERAAVAKIRVAVASSDGKVVNRHFGHAERFLVFELDGAEFRFIATRDNPPVCKGGTHDEAALEQAVHIISDCSYVIAVKVGPGAAARLSAERIRAFVDADFIDASLEKLLRSGRLRYLRGK